MGARKKRRVGLGARAGAESTSIELALEGARRLARGKAEARAGQVGGVRRPLVDGHYRDGRVDRPRVARAARVPGCIGGFRGECVGSVRKPREVLRRCAALEGPRVELALISDSRSVSRAELEV